MEISTARPIELLYPFEVSQILFMRNFPYCLNELPDPRLESISWFRIRKLSKNLKRMIKVFLLNHFSFFGIPRSGFSKGRSWAICILTCRLTIYLCAAYDLILPKQSAVNIKWVLSGIDCWSSPNGINCERLLNKRTAAS